MHNANVCLPLKFDLEFGAPWAVGLYTFLSGRCCMLASLNGNRKTIRDENKCNNIYLKKLHRNERRNS